MAVQFDHQCLTEAHHLIPALALGVEIGPTLATAHGQGGQRVLERLLEGEELENRQVDRGVKSHTPLEGADGRIVLDAERAVDVRLAVVVGPRDAKLNDPLRLDQTLEKRRVGILRVGQDEVPDAAHHFLHCLHELRLAGIPGPDIVHEIRQILVFHFALPCL